MGEPNNVGPDPKPPHPAAKHSLKFFILGSIQLLSALICTIIGIFGFAYGIQRQSRGSYESYYVEDPNRLTNYTYEVEAPPYAYMIMANAIVAGVFFIVSGILGILASRSPTNCNVIAGIVMTVLSILASSNLVYSQMTGMGIIGIQDLAKSDYYRLKGLYLTLILLGIFTSIICVIHSAYSCASSCCDQERQRGKNDESA